MALNKSDGTATVDNKEKTNLLANHTISLNYSQPFRKHKPKSESDNKMIIEDEAELTSPINLDISIEELKDAIQICHQSSPGPDEIHYKMIQNLPKEATSCLCKTMERIINNRLIWFLERYQMVSETQSGFR